MYHLFPEPKQWIYYDSSLTLSCSAVFTIHPQLLTLCCHAGFDIKAALNVLFSQQMAGDDVNISIRFSDVLPESFYLSIGNDGIVLSCSDGAGVFYGIQALSQLISQGNGELPYAEIADEPALSIRGIMMDIGRDKIPSMKTLYRLIDLFAAMRINHLQLYMEGFSFDYEQYRYLFTNETPVTPEEFQLLSSYAKARFIDLVPNLNVLGHMEKWLEKPQFLSLAECEDGFIFENLFRRPPMTLDVQDEASLSFARELIDSLVKYSSSEYINVNMDEPFELGMGKNKETAGNGGRLSLYLGYLEKIHEHCTSKNLKMMVWGDEILHNPDCVAQFPKDVTLLDWIYEGDASFEPHARMMQATGLKYCLCPGTSSWGSLTGRNDNMQKNIIDAVTCAVKYGGQGIITTDWGDLGHWQYISASYIGFAYTAFCSWSGPGKDLSLIPWYCNHDIYHSPDETAYKAAWNLGNYYHLEKAPLYNITLAFAVISSKYVFNSIEEFDKKMARMLTLSANIARSNNIAPQEPEINIDFRDLDDYLSAVDLEIQEASIHCPDAQLIKAEMNNGLRMIRHGIRLYHTMTILRNDKAAFCREMKILFDDLDDIMKIHYRLWISRNRSGGFQRSTSHMNYLLSFYKKMIKETDAYP